MKLTEAQRRALRTLDHLNGEGSIDRYGRVVSAGERITADPATFLRLITLGMVKPDGPHRIAITDAGRAALTE